MESSLTLLPLLAPFGLVVAAVVARRDRRARPDLALAATRAAAMFAIVIAGLTAAFAAIRPPLTSSLIGFNGLGLAVRIDGLSVVMLALVASLGAFVMQFSRNYLAGDRRQGVFLGDLSLTVACVMVLVLAGNLVQLVIGWVATSLALHQLLLFYPDRRGAVVAAHKKFILARLGDACLTGAAILLVSQFGTGDLGAVLEGATMLGAADQVPVGIHFAVALIGMAAFLKAAQFPAHGWLIEMQETPTPVSALLHAGILNGGTFLVVRLGSVVQLSTPVLVALIVVGGFTAVFASVVMLTDSRVKATLAYSSAAHMGFMLLLCGIGAPSVAIAHLVAHSFYKAHAFLSSGSAVEAAKASVVPRKAGTIPALRVLLSYALTAGIVFSIGSAMGFEVFESTTNLVLAAIMVVALSHLMAQAASGELSARVLARTALSVTLTTLSFYTLERCGGAILGHAVPVSQGLNQPLTVAIAVVVAIFTLVTILQVFLPRLTRSPGVAAAYVLVRNGLYANSYFDRLIGAAKKPVGRMSGAAVVHETDDFARPISSEVVRTTIDRTTRAVAPVWPLETFVAVNPFQGLAHHSVDEAAYVVARTAGARMTMPREYYLDAIKRGRISATHIDEALAEARARGNGEIATDAKSLLEGLRDGDQPALPTIAPTVAGVLSELTGTDWERIMTERIGAWAATYFDEGQASWRSPWKQLPPYEAFRAEASLDGTPEVLGARGFREAICKLPGDASSATTSAIARLGIPEVALESYLQRLLASIGGWAAYARRRVWDRELHGEVDTTLEELLAVRLAWEVALLEAFAARGAENAWSRARAALCEARDRADTSRTALRVDLVLQAAYEKGWQETLIESIDARTNAMPSRRDKRPSVQAVFCIDVRSELFRGALEKVDSTCETIGFAGFFGFPVEYVPIGQTHGGAQCPVLLAAKGVVVESVIAATNDESARVGALRVLDRRTRNAWKSFKSSAIACFGFVGPVGLAYLPKLLTDSLGITRAVPHPKHDGVEGHISLGPDLSPHNHADRRVGLTAEERLAMAEGLLRGMSLTSGFARLVMITGHGSTTVNNPHAASLDCGACGGHTGEANARIAAMVLNESEVRRALAAKGIDIPSDTVFLAALHDTTTDLVTIFDRHAVPASHADDLARLDTRLAAAGVAARRIRAPSLGEDPADESVDARIFSRGRDWAQVRPEWGLAGCAAFIVAPRHRTAGIDLGGRAFLHSYDWREDERAGFPVLDLVMTAPMVVGSWINLQYYASTVDNRVYGCGNKVLHNVVGTIGVLEGNGGDLRVGLPWQSVHDGERFVHEPMRLNVVIEAPISALNAIIAKHPEVRALLDNGWLHLFALGDSGAVTHRYVGGLCWEPIQSAKTELAA